jgi:hypothetical protein
MAILIEPSNALSASDSRILDTIFDPEGNPATQTVTIDPTVPADPHIPASLLPTLQATEARAIRTIEHCQTGSAADEAVQEAAYAAALKTLDQLVDEQPRYASARNNRAQLRRWRFGDAALAGDAARAADAAAVLADLDAALALAAPAGGDGGRGEGVAPVSPQRARVLARAWAQRGAVMLAAARHRRRRPGRPAVEADSAEPERQSRGGTAEDRYWTSWDAGRLEEEASRSFFEAGRFGCAASRALAVRTNLYARMCGAIVGEALRREGVEGGLV